MRREVPLFITFISGVLLVIALFIPHKPFGNLEQRFNDWYIIVSGFTMILGIDSLLLHHWNRFKRKREGWIYSIALILAFFITLIWGFYSGIKVGSPFKPNSSFLKYFYTFVFVPLQATMFSLLAFFIASAAYRAFRARTFDATLLLTAAAFVMLGRVPEGNRASVYLFGIALLIAAVILLLEAKERVSAFEKLLHYLGAIMAIVLIYILYRVLPSYLPQIADWVMNIPQLAAKRGIFIGIALGGIAMSLRIILGIERTYLK